MRGMKCGELNVKQMQRTKPYGQKRIYPSLPILPTHGSHSVGFSTVVQDIPNVDTPGQACTVNVRLVLWSSS